MSIIALPDAVTNGIVFAGKCIPSNDALATPLSGPLVWIAGAFWGLVPYIIAFAVVALVLIIIATSMKETAKKWMIAIAIVVAVPVAAWLIMLIYFSLTGNLPDVAACPF